MIYLGLGLAFLCCVIKTLRGYFQMEGYLKYKAPVNYKRIEARPYTRNTLYDSINGIINTKEYQNH